MTKDDSAFAQRVAEALSQRKIASKLIERDLDRGAFVLMSLMRLEADIPIVTVSINDRLGAAAYQTPECFTPFVIAAGVGMDEN